MDHRVVHCQLQLRVGQQRELQRKCRHFRVIIVVLHFIGSCCENFWQNNQTLVWKKSWNRVCTLLQRLLVRARARIEPSTTLRDLRLRRLVCVDSSTRRELSLRISPLHRAEMRQWKSTKLGELLQHRSTWKCVKALLSKFFGSQLAARPHA